MITINALKIRTKLGGILDNVSQKGEHYIIERMGKPMAVIVPYNQFDFEKKQKETRQKRMEEAAKKMDKLYEKYGKKYTPGESGRLGQTAPRGRAILRRPSSTIAQ